MATPLTTATEGADLSPVVEGFLVRKNGAKKLATIPAIAPGFRGMQQIPLDPPAQQAFSNFAKDFQTPFNIIMSTVMTVRGDQKPPQGRLDVNVSGKAKAKL